MKIMKNSQICSCPRHEDVLWE